MISTVSQRWWRGVAVYRPTGETIVARDYDVALLPKDGPAKAFVLTHHYEGSYPAARVRVALHRRDRLVGVAVFSQPCNDLALRPLPGGAASNLQLGRFVLLDDVPANGETWFLGRAFELLRRAGYSGVVSFSDPMPRTSLSGTVTFRGHVGVIYQAHNAVYLGRTRADAMRLLPDGRVLHSRAIAKVRKRDRGWRYVVDSLIDHGASRPARDEDLRAWLAAVLPTVTRSVRHPGNHKYVWALARTLKKFLPTSKTYPKFDLHETAARSMRRAADARGGRR
ncbi:hypothetical protein LZC95_07715 [Pendulispora brunnea]|uniref:Uncharacterized protein n=1 Tax=Pendulispora brunnea TaxID=2905690 RepID=A0ABZ2KDE5_9BACT